MYSENQLARGSKMFTLKSGILLLLMIGLGRSYLPPGSSSLFQDNLKLAERLFGPPVQGHPCLFEINRDHALRIDVDKSGGVTNLEILPKYFLQNLMPEWKEPDHTVGLSNKEYLDLFSKVVELKPVGKVVSQGKVGVVANSRLWLLDEYQNAFIQRRLNRTSQDTANTPDTINSFSIYYIRGIEGLVDEKQAVDEFGTGQRFKIKVNGCWYLTTKLEFDKARKGDRALVHAAGPLDDAQSECSTE